LRRHLGQRDGLPRGVGQVFRVNLHVLAIPQRLAFDPHDAVLVGQQVVEGGLADRKEIEVGFASRATGAFAGLARGRFRFSGGQARAAIAASGDGLLHGLERKLVEAGIANLPGIEQQPGAGEHVAGVKFAVAAFEDVAVFISDLAAGGEQVRLLGRGP